MDEQLAAIRFMIVGASDLALSESALQTQAQLALVLERIDTFAEEFATTPGQAG